MDLESVNADITAAADTARVNQTKIAQSREILKRAGEALEKIRDGRSGSGPEWADCPAD